MQCYFYLSVEQLLKDLEQGNVCKIKLARGQGKRPEFIKKIFIYVSCENRYEKGRTNIQLVSCF